MASLLTATVAAPLLATTGPAQAAPASTELRLTDFSPISVGYGQTVRASGTFTTSQTLDDVVVQFEIGGTRFVTRSAITEAASTPPDTTPVFGATDPLGKVREGQTATFRISFPSADLPFDSPGVYPMKLTAIDTATGLEVSAVSSFLPWAPEGLGVVPSRLLMFWPVIGEAELTTATDDEAKVDLLTDSLGPGGRLATLVSSGQRAPATWLLDPAVLDQAAELRSELGDDWVDEVAERAQRTGISSVPYGDPDVAAVAAADRPSFLEQGQRKAERVTRRLLEGTTRTDLAWPAEGAGDDDTITTAARADDAFVLLDEENAPLTTPQTFTPSGRIAWEDPEIDVLLADEPVSALTASPASTPNDVLLARQRFLAETLLHSQEISDPRLLVVAPPRRWSPSPLWADELVRAARNATWLDAVTLDEAVEPGPPPFERETPAIPTEVAERQLASDLVLDAQAGLTDNRRFAAILTRPAQLAPPIEDDLFDSVSTAWRGEPQAAATSQQLVLDELQALRNRVRIVSQGGTLADDRGSFPVTIRNQLDQPVVVRLAVSSTDPLRLRVDGPDETIRIPAEGSDSQEVELDAVTSGRLSFNAQLQTPGGADYDDPVTMLVDVRGFGRITLLVFGAAVALLVVAAGLRIFRRIRRAQRADR